MIKHDLKELSIVLSVKIDSKDRKTNLGMILDYIEHLFINHETIIVEQDMRSQIKSIIRGRKGVSHYLIQSNEVHYKTRNLNYATNLATREIIMMCDCDVICPPKALIEAVESMKRGASFLSPHNGLMVELKKSFFTKAATISHILDSLVYFPKDFNSRLSEFDHSNMTPLYGSSLYESAGGCIFYKKNDFYRIGGWNTNFISYGYEDAEFVYRLKAMGYKLNMLPHHNIYHLEHERTFDSIYNNYFRSNEAEWKNVTSMSGKELIKYSFNGFRHIKYLKKEELNVINVAHKYSIESYKADKFNMGDVCILLPVYLSDPVHVSYINIFSYYLEMYFNNYEVLILEAENRNCKYLANKKFTRYVWMGTDKFSQEKAIEKGLQCSSRNLVALWDFCSLIDPKQVMKSVKSLRKTKKPRTLRDNNWFISGCKKIKKGEGVILGSKNDFAHFFELQK